MLRKGSTDLGEHLPADAALIAAPLESTLVERHGKGASEGQKVV